MTALQAESIPPALANQPLATVERDGVRYTLLGTAHVSRASVEAVEAALQWQKFDVVAVELCESRYGALADPNALQKLDLFRVIREGKTGLVAANLALSAYQRRLAEQLGIEPGAEMRAAIAAAQAHGLPVWRIDRDVGVTLRRAYAATGFWGRMKIVSGLLAGLLVSDGIEEEEIERLKQGDMLESAFSEFAQRSQPLYHALIAERDRFMGAALREEAQKTPIKNVLVVIGAGHLPGLSEALASDNQPPTETHRQLSALPPPGRLGTWLTVLLTVLVGGGFIYAFSQGAALGTAVVLNWILATGTLGALGCLLAGGHPFSMLAAFLASPITPLHPALASGTVSALAELWLRRPTVADFSRLRDDLGTWSGWWKNRVARLFVNFFLTSLGTAIGVYVAGWKMLQQLF